VHDTVPFRYMYAPRSSVPCTGGLATRVETAYRNGSTTARVCTDHGNALVRHSTKYYSPPIF
jgi:hypothetical protein